jgi:hypothetical protein
LCAQLLAAKAIPALLKLVAQAAAAGPDAQQAECPFECSSLL